MEEATERTRSSERPHPRLLQRLGLPTRGAHSRPLCPLTQFAAGQ